MSQEQIIYEYIIIENQKHIWLPPHIVWFMTPLNIGSPPRISASDRNTMFKRYFKGYSNSILTQESWEDLKKNHIVMRIFYGDMK